MRDAISVQPGAVPWKPAADAELVVEYDRHDIPTIGIVRQSGTEYLFRCASGHGSAVSAWTYAPIDRAHRAAIERAEGRTDVDAALREAAKFPAVLAIAAEGFGIIASETIPSPSVAAAASARLLQSFDKWRDGWCMPPEARRDLELALTGQ